MTREQLHCFHLVNPSQVLFHKKLPSYDGLEPCGGGVADGAGLQPVACRIKLDRPYQVFLWSFPMALKDTISRLSSPLNNLVVSRQTTVGNSFHSGISWYISLYAWALHLSVPVNWYTLSCSSELLGNQDKQISHGKWHPAKPKVCLCLLPGRPC